MSCVDTDDTRNVKKCTASPVSLSLKPQKMNAIYVFRLLKSANLLTLLYELYFLFKNIIIEHIFSSKRGQTSQLLVMHCCRQYRALTHTKKTEGVFVVFCLYKDLVQNSSKKASLVAATPLRLLIRSSFELPSQSYSLLFTFILSLPSNVNHMIKTHRLWAQTCLE